MSEVHKYSRTIMHVVHYIHTTPVTHIVICKGSIHEMNYPCAGYAGKCAHNASAVSGCIRSCFLLQRSICAELAKPTRILLWRCLTCEYRPLLYLGRKVARKCFISNKYKTCLLERNFLSKLQKYNAMYPAARFHAAFPPHHKLYMCLCWAGTEVCNGMNDAMFQNGYNCVWDIRMRGGIYT